MHVPRGTFGVEFHVQHAPGYRPALFGARQAGILNGVFQIEQHARHGARIAVVDQDGAAFQQVAVPFQSQVDNGVEQRVPGTNESRQRLSRGRDQRLVERNALVTGQHGFADPDKPVSTSHRCRHVGDLVTSRLALPDGATQVLECFPEK